MIIINKTNALIVLLDKLLIMYNEERNVDLQKDINAFNEVKEDISMHITFVEEWEYEALEFIKNNKTALFPQQINATKDNLIKLIFNSYYQDSRTKPYMNLYNSCLFILNQLEKEVN